MSCNKFGNKNIEDKESSEIHISWKEHVIDDFELSGQKISGGDGLVMADLDQDGFGDVISVHESDWQYDGVPRGHIRIAFGTNNPDVWELFTLGEGEEVGAVEDVAVGDINNDGYLDIVAACELAHIIYFENPIVNVKTQKWQRLIPKITLNRGSFIRVFTGDLNNDGQLEVIAANKGSQTGKGENVTKKPVSYFEITGDPLDDASWKETVLKNVLVPINSQPIDIDNDGDLDIIIGSRGEFKITLMENQGTKNIQFSSHAIDISKEPDLKNIEVSGFNMEFADFNNDGLLDIILVSKSGVFVWIEQPLDFSDVWIPHKIGSLLPDLLAGFIVAGINNDTLKDILVGGYSRGPRTKDGDQTINDELGSIAWFEQSKDKSESWKFHPVLRRKRGMYDKFVAKDMDADGDTDFVFTRGNSHPHDGVFWIEQIRTAEIPKSVFIQARVKDSKAMPFTEEQLKGTE